MVSMPACIQVYVSVHKYMSVHTCLTVYGSSSKISKCNVIPHPQGWMDPDSCDQVVCHKTSEM